MGSSLPKRSLRQRLSPILRWPGWRLARWGFLAALLLLLLLLSPMLRTTRITPPAMVDSPVTVFLLDHGSTPSLVLPDEERGMVRYVYGDWRWYAQGDKGAWNGIRALAWPTRGALGRRALPETLTEAGIGQQLEVADDDIHTFVVEREAARRLRQELDRTFRANADSLLANEDYGLDFVHHPRRYTYFHNSNHEAAQWLQRLQCRVDGPAFASRWRVNPSD